MSLPTTVRERRYQQYRDIFGEQFQVNAPLAKHTSARVGGAAEMLVTVRTGLELQTAVELAYNQRIPYIVLGGGSNILVADAGVEGLVILNRARQVSFRHTGFSVICTAESGTNLSSLARQCISKGLGGLEWAISVPGTVGGAVFGNAGAHGGELKGNLRAALIWEPGIGARMYGVDELQFSYRESLLKREKERRLSRRTVIAAELELQSESIEVLTARANGFTAHRKETQPGGASMGSMFKNPENYYAGYLIETAGLKGLTIGGARISEKHANFFVNDGDATAEDVRSLIAEAWNTVREQFGVEMELEVELVGNWEFVQ